MFIGSNWARKSRLSKILTEPLNPRVRFPHAIKNTIYANERCTFHSQGGLKNTKPTEGFINK